MVTASRPARTTGVTDAVVEVAQGAPGGVAAALVGSWARGTARPGSDVDLVVLTEQPEALLQDSTWHRAFGVGARLVRSADFGGVQERRLLLPSGLEVEVCIGRPSWAATAPVDAGTRRVVTDGLVVLWDPHDLLRALVEAVRADAG